jgi:hypothetical protein
VGASMPSHSPAISVELLLEAARQRVAQTSLREAAAEIGMEHSGLDKLLKRDQQPRPSTIRKLTEWYLLHTAAGDLETRPQVAQAALDVLLQHLVPAKRAEVRNQLLALLRTASVEQGVATPTWLKR